MIVKKDDKIYFQAWLAKTNGYLDASAVVGHAKSDLRELELKYKPDHPAVKYLQSIYNKLTAQYFSPSFMKGYIENPALSVYSFLSREIDINSAAEIGTTFHRVLEEYYKLNKKDRDRSLLVQLTNQYTPEGQDKYRVLNYIEGFLSTGDYLDEVKKDEDNNEIPFDNHLECFCEFRGKDTIKVPLFNYTLPLPLSYIADRVDVRDDKLYIIDYKTGKSMGKHSATFDGYLGSMILYKWAVEQVFQLPVEGAYLLCPAYKEENKYIPLNFSLVNQSKVIDLVDNFCKNYINDCQKSLFKFNKGCGFTYSKEYKKLEEFMKDKYQLTLPIEIELGDAK